MLPHCPVCQEAYDNWRLEDYHDWSTGEMFMKLLELGLIKERAG